MQSQRIVQLQKLSQPRPVSMSALPGTTSTTIHVFTLGLMNTETELVNLCCSSDGNWVNVSDREMREALVRLNAGDVQVVSDMRRFCDPAAVGTLTRHIGTHPETMRRMTNTRHFGPWLRGLRMSIKEVLDRQRKDREVRVALYCRSGKHRSVAGARFLEHIAEAEGWAYKVEHLASKSWKNICRGHCEECQGSPEIREEALTEALRIWRR